MQDLLLGKIKRPFIDSNFLYRGAPKASRTWRDLGHFVR
jgi:hypothetical protein